MRGICLVALGVPALAQAYDFEVSAQTVGQGDQIRRFSDDNVVLLNRRRLTQMLGLRLFNFLPAPDPDSGKVAPRLQLVSQMRFDSNFGDFADNRDAEGVVAVPEIEDDQFDLLLLYLEGKDFWRGTTDFRLGRQVMDDPLDWYAFDGAEIFFHPPVFVGVEGFAGWQVRGSDPLSSPVMELDGTGASILSDEPTVASPMFGGALVTHGLRDIQARASYRRTFSDSTITVTDLESNQQDQQFFGITEEKLAVSVRGRLWDTAYPYGGFRYNLLVARLDLVEAGARVQIHPQHALTPAYVRVIPTFAGDSIFNVFSTEPYQEGSLTYDFDRSRFRSYAKYSVRQTHNEAEGEMTETAALSHGSGLGTRYVLRRGTLRADGRFDTGYGGFTAGGDVSGIWNLLNDRIALEGRVTALRYESDRALRDEPFLRAMWTFGLQAGARYRLVDGVALHLLAEENHNQLYSSYFRVLALLDLATQP